MIMSAKSDALEDAVTALIQARTALEAAPGPRARARVDRAFAHLLALTAPRIRYFTRSYGLAEVAEDAAQACAIALHRAAERYDPARSRFTTYVNWQIRAELQALRLRLHGDQRCAGRRAAGATLSLDALAGRSGMSPRNFIRRFKAATGSLPGAYVQMLRMSAAKELLEAGATSIQAVCAKTGYADIVFFRSLFKRHTGMTPAEYRRRFAHMNFDRSELVAGHRA